MKQIIRHLSMAALALMGAIMTGCSSSDDTVADTPKLPENTGKVVTLTTTVGFDDKAGTRALTSGGVKTFAVGETMALVYRSMSKKRTVKESEPLAAGDIAAGGKSATFTFNLTEEPDKTKDVTYIYPAAMADADGNENDEALCTEQDGTLAKLASNFDFATTHNNLDWDGDNLPGATLENQLAILAITLKDDATDADITGSITGLTLTTRNDSHTESMTYNITRSAAAGPIYVAIYPTRNATIDVTATGGAYTYTKTLTYKIYQASKGYNVSWRMTNTMQSVPLTVEALTAGTIVVNPMLMDMKYSVNGHSMTSISHGPMETTISVEAGDKVQFYGNSNYYFFESRYNNIAGGTAQVKVYGNIMSLVNETDFATKTTLDATYHYAFAYFFYGNTNLTDASGLLLPATTLAEGCYADMFYNCTNLTIAPVLPAETLVTNCYMSMFFGCTKLNSVTCLATNISASNCTGGWLFNAGTQVTGTKTFTTPSTTNWSTGADGIPGGWTRLNPDGSPYVAP